MPYWYVTLSRRRQYTEEGVAFVEARTAEEAMGNAFDMVDAHEVDFVQEPSGVDHAISNLQVVRVEQQDRPPPRPEVTSC